MNHSSPILIDRLVMIDVADLYSWLKHSKLNSQIKDFIEESSLGNPFELIKYCEEEVEGDMRDEDRLQFYLDNKFPPSCGQTEY